MTGINVDRILALAPSPAYVVDLGQLRRNLSILNDVQQRSGAKILMAMKAFSMWSVFPLIRQTLHGVTSEVTETSRDHTIDTAAVVTMTYYEAGGRIGVKGDRATDTAYWSDMSDNWRNNPSGVAFNARAALSAGPVGALLGAAQPASASAVVSMAWGGANLHLIDTPGHAKHHHCLWDEASGGWVTGDTFGLSYREFDVDGRPWLLPTTTPVQFEPEALKLTVARLMNFEPQRMYLTHYGAVGGSVAAVITSGSRYSETKGLVEPPA